jgi:hypothetical protein
MGGMLSAGMAYYEARLSLLRELKIGLTEFYNLYKEGNLPQFSQISHNLDLVVFGAYGWNDFALNFPNDEQIIRRLLDLHAERLKAERTAVPTSGAAAPKAKKPKKSADTSGPDLFNT